MGGLTLIIGNRNYSSWSLRAWLALQATGAPFEEVVVRLGLPGTATEIARHSPSGRVPILRDGDLVIWDSMAIGEYLAERFPDAGLWPADPGRRATARSVVAEMHSGFMALRSAMPMNIRASYPAGDPGPEVGADIRRIASIWEACRRDLGAGGDFLFGSFGLADAFYAPVVSRFRTYGVGLDGAAGAYMTAVWAWPAVQSWVAAAEAEPWVVERYER